MLGFLPFPRTPAAGLDSVFAAPAADGPAHVAGLAVHQITSVTQFDAITQPAGDLLGNGRLTKFLVDLRNPGQPQVVFTDSNFRINGETPNEARYHYFFAKAVLGIPEEGEEFNDVTYFTHEKRYVAGVLHSYELNAAAAPILGYQFHPLDVIREQQLLRILRTVSAKISGIPWSAAFVPTAGQQTTAAIGDELGELGFVVLPQDRIVGSVDYLALNEGQAWGHLRIFPADSDELLPTDIPVFEELPLDLSVVAGVMTKAVQDTNSHVNLKSKERRTPNAVLRSAGPDHEQLAALADEPVHFVVAKEGFTLTPSTESDVAAKLAEKMDRPMTPLSWERDDAVRSFDEFHTEGAQLALRAARRYGSKVANLAFLSHAAVLGRRDDFGSPSATIGYDLVPPFVAVPLQMYRDFVDHPPNAELRRMIDELGRV